MTELVGRPEDVAESARWEAEKGEASWPTPETEWAVQVKMEDGSLWTSQAYQDRKLVELVLSGLMPAGEAWLATRTVLAGEWERVA